MSWKTSKSSSRVKRPIMPAAGTGSPGGAPAAGEHVVDRRAEREDIGAPVDERGVEDLLGRRVAERPEGLPLRRDRRLGGRADHLREAVVEELHLARAGDDDVRGLQVAVDDP